MPETIQILQGSDAAVAGHPTGGWFVGWPPGVRRFAILMVCFWTPVFLTATLFEMFLWRMGETWPVTAVLVAQRTGGGIFQRAGEQSFALYKYKGFTLNRPRVLALGSSRVMQFRGEMFGEGPYRSRVEFYNAGGMIQSLDDLSAFVVLVDKSDGLEVVILGIDMWWLNAALKPQIPVVGFAESVVNDPALSWQNHLLLFRRLAFGDTLTVRRVKDILSGRQGRGASDWVPNSRGRDFAPMAASSPTHPSAPARSISIGRVRQ